MLKKVTQRVPVKRATRAHVDAQQDAECSVRRTDMCGETKMVPRTTDSTARSAWPPIPVPEKVIRVRIERPIPVPEKTHTVLVEQPVPKKRVITVWVSKEIPRTRKVIVLP
jgi:hypothetical protein